MSVFFFFFGGGGKKGGFGSFWFYFCWKFFGRAGLGIVVGISICFFFTS